MQNIAEKAAEREFTRLREVAAWCNAHIGRPPGANWVQSIVRLRIDDLGAAMDSVERECGGIRSEGFLYRRLEELECQRLKGPIGVEMETFAPIGSYAGA